VIRWLRGNYRLKTASFFLAVVVWFFVHGITSEQHTVRRVPLDVRVRPGIAVLEQSLTGVDVTVRGTRDDVRRLTRNEVTVVLDLTGSPVLGEQTHRLGRSTIRMPRWVRPVDVTPAEVRLVLDETTERALDVEARLTGEQELPPGYVVERVVIKPTRVMLRGPRSRLAQLAKILTLPIDVSGRQTSFRERVELTPLELGTGLAERHWVEVDVRIGRAPPPEPPASRSPPAHSPQ